MPAGPTGRDDIGMLLGQRQTLAALGPLGNAMRHAATLGEAIAAFVGLPDQQFDRRRRLSHARGPGRHPRLWRL